MKQSTKEVVEQLLDIKEKYFKCLEDSVNDFIAAIESEQDSEIKSTFYKAKEKCYLSHLNIDDSLKDTFESLGYTDEV